MRWRYQQRKYAFTYALTAAVFVAVFFTASAQDLKSTACGYKEADSDFPSYQQAQRARNILSSVRPPNPIISALETSDFETYHGSLVQAYVALAILAVLVAIFYAVQFLQVFGQRFIEVLRRDVEKEPYGQFSIWFYVFATCAVSALLFSFSSALIDSTRLLQPSLNKAACTSLTIFDEWNYALGLPRSSNWPGTNKFQSILDELVYNLQSAESLLRDTFDPANSAFLSDYPDLEAYISTNLQSLSATYTVPLPNPERTLPKQVQPDIVYLLGQSTVLDPNTVCGSLMIELQTQIAVMRDQLVKLKESSLYLADSTTTMVDALQSDSQNLMADFTQQFKTLQANATHHFSYFRLFNDHVVRYAQSLASVVMSFAVGGCVGMAVVMYFRTVELRALVYGAWLVIGCFSFLAWALAIYQYTQTQVYQELCGALDDYARNETLFIKLRVLPHADTAKSCFFGDGALDTAFVLHDKLQWVVEVSNDLANLRSFEYLFGTDYTARAAINEWITRNDAYADFSTPGVAITSANGLLPLDLPDAALDSLNAWSDISHITADGQPSMQYSVACGVLSYDKIVYRRSDCDRPLPDPNDPSSLLQQQACIYLEGKALDATLDDYTPLYIEQRLSHVTRICSGLNSYKDNYLTAYASLYAYTQAFLAQVSGAGVGGQPSTRDALDGYKTLSAQYTADLQTLYEAATLGMQPSIQPLLDTAARLYNNFNCSFMRDDFVRVRTDFCQGFVFRAYSVSWQLIVVALLATFAGVGFYFSTQRVVFFANKRTRNLHALAVQRAALMQKRLKGLQIVAGERVFDQSSLDAGGQQPFYNQNGAGVILEQSEYPDAPPEHGMDLSDDDGDGGEPVNAGLGDAQGDGQQQNQQQRPSSTQVRRKARQRNRLPIETEQFYRREENQGVALNADELAFIQRNIEVDD